MAKIKNLETAALSGESGFPVHPKPQPHIRRKTMEPLRCWSTVTSLVSMPRLFLSPYVGCEANCEFCFTRSFPGLFRLADQQQILTVYENYVEHFREQLARIRIAPPALLSPFTDPFQPLNERYGISEKLVQECVMKGLPIEIWTRYHIPDEVIAMLRHLPRIEDLDGVNRPLARVIMSIDPMDRKGDVPYYLERLDSVERMRKLGIDVVPRLDPIFPGDDGLEEKLEEKVTEITRREIPHLTVSFGKLPGALPADFLNGSKKLYENTAEEPGWKIAKFAERKSILDILRKMCDSLNTTLGIFGPSQLQQEYGTYSDIFPWMLPISQRESSEDIFKPVMECIGNCFLCPEAVCGIEELRGIESFEGDLTSADWDRWSRTRLQESLLR